MKHAIKIQYVAKINNVANALVRGIKKHGPRRKRKKEGTNPFSHALHITKYSTFKQFIKQFVAGCGSITFAGDLSRAF